MKKTFALAAAILCLTATLFAREDWRGNNRLAGVIILAFGVVALVGLLV